MSIILLEFDEVQRLRKPRKVRLGNDTIIYAYGIGTVLLDTRKSILKLQNVLYIPDLGCNLISVGKTVQAGCRVIFDEPNCCKIVNKSSDQVLA